MIDACDDGVGYLLRGDDGGEDRQLKIFCDHHYLSSYRPHLFQASLSPLIVPTVDQPHLSASLATVKNLKMSSLVSLSSSFSYIIYNHHLRVHHYSTKLIPLTFWMAAMTSGSLDTWS